MLNNKSDSFDSMETRYKVQFVNSLIGHKPVNLIGTIDSEKKTNLSIVSSCFHLGANPALIGMIIRPDSVPRHTLENIKETNSWTINSVQEEFIKKAHQTSARYPKETSEFNATELTEVYIDNFIAPYVKESIIKLGLELREVVELKINGTVLVIGEIKDFHIPTEIVSKDGHINLDKTSIVSVCGLDHYNTVENLIRLSYAKPDSWPEEIQ